MARSKVFVPLKLPRSEEERRAFDQKLKEGQVSGNAPVVTVAPTVANFGGGSADAARILKAIKVLHAAFGEDMPSEYRAEVTVPIPVGIVDAVIDILARTAEKAREARAASSQEKRLRRDEIRERRGCSIREAAHILAKELHPGDDAKIERATETIRKLK
jgi:hypothetical protein